MPRSKPDRADCYRIAANAPTGPLAEARLNRPSAVVLAMRWEALGYGDVTITDPSNQPYTLAEFRVQHVPRYRKGERTPTPNPRRPSGRLGGSDSFSPE